MDYRRIGLGEVRFADAVIVKEHHLHRRQRQLGIGKGSVPAEFQKRLLPIYRVAEQVACQKPREGILIPSPPEFVVIIAVPKPLCVRSAEMKPLCRQFFHVRRIDEVARQLAENPCRPQIPCEPVAAVGRSVDRRTAGIPVVPNRNILIKEASRHEFVYIGIFIVDRNGKGEPVPQKLGFRLMACRHAISARRHPDLHAGCDPVFHRRNDRVTVVRGEQIVTPVPDLRRRKHGVSHEPVIIGKTLKGCHVKILSDEANGIQTVLPVSVQKVGIRPRFDCGECDSVTGSGGRHQSLQIEFPQTFPFPHRRRIDRILPLFPQKLRLPLCHQQPRVSRGRQDARSGISARRHFFNCAVSACVSVVFHGSFPPFRLSMHGLRRAFQCVRR